MFARILIWVSLCLSCTATQAFQCLAGTDSNGQLIANYAFQNALTIDANVPDGAVISEIDVGIGVTDPSLDIACHGYLVNTLGSTTVSVIFPAVVTPPNGNNTHPPGYPTFSSLGINGIYYQVAEKGSNITLGNIYDNPTFFAVQGNGNFGSCSSLLAGDWTSCAGGELTTVANEHTTYGTLWYHVTLMKYNGGQPLAGGTYSFNGRFMMVGIRTINAGNTGNYGNVTLTTPISITVSSTCQYDLSQMPGSLPGSVAVSADFANVTDQGGPGTVLAPDASFSINFKNCGSSPVPNVQFTTYGSDTVDSQGNFPLYSPSYSAANRTNAGMGFAVIDNSASPGRTLTPNGPYVEITAPTASGGIYPSSTTNVAWPFSVRLIKSTNGGLTPGTFEGRANFTIAYK